MCETTASISAALKKEEKVYALLQEQVAGFGPLHVPPHKQIHLEESEMKIRELKAQLEALAKQESQNPNSRPELLQLRPLSKNNLLSANLVTFENDNIQLVWDLYLSFYLTKTVSEKLYIPMHTLKASFELPNMFAPRLVVFNPVSFIVPNPNLMQQSPTDPIFNDGYQLILTGPGALNISGHTQTSNFNITDRKGMARLDFPILVSFEFGLAGEERPLNYTLNFEIDSLDPTGRNSTWRPE